MSGEFFYISSLNLFIKKNKNKIEEIVFYGIGKQQNDDGSHKCDSNSNNPPSSLPRSPNPKSATSPPWPPCQTQATKLTQPQIPIPKTTFKTYRITQCHSLLDLLLSPRTQSSAEPCLPSPTPSLGCQDLMSYTRTSGSLL